VRLIMLEEKDYLISTILNEAQADACAIEGFQPIEVTGEFFANDFIL